MTTFTQNKVDFWLSEAGLPDPPFALKVAKHGKVIIITKANSEDSIQICSGRDCRCDARSDTFEKHVQDTLECGAGLCDERIVRMVVTEGPRIRGIIEWGTRFDKNETGSSILQKKADTVSIAYCISKMHGNEIERALLEQIHQHPNISIYTLFCR
ncbi:MAG: FAD-binding protein [Bacteroidetes bacterium]|nr:FAD-binding protein [Bacteroidota bacterium]